jgi:hypothetical protein
MNKRFKQVILLIGDLVILHLTLWISLMLRFLILPSESLWQNNLPYFGQSLPFGL